MIVSDNEMARRFAIANIVARHWNEASIKNGWTSAAHALAMVLGALEGETDPLQMGITEAEPTAAILATASDGARRNNKKQEILIIPDPTDEHPDRVKFVKRRG